MGIATGTRTAGIAECRAITIDDGGEFFGANLNAHSAVLIIRVSVKNKFFIPRAFFIFGFS